MKTTALASICISLALMMLSPYTVADQNAVQKQMNLEQQPSLHNIIQWLSNLDQSHADPKNAIEIERTEEIRLHSGEKAYLSAVNFNNSARNYALGYILTRPNLKESRILEAGGQSNYFNVEYVHLPQKEHAIGLIEIESAGSGQGYISHSKSINYIQDWEVKTLHEVDFGSNGGARDDCKDSYDDQAYLHIVDQYILEITVEANGCANKKPKDYVVKNRFITIQIP